jgi:hypothetical protein
MDKDRSKIEQPKNDYDDWKLDNRDDELERKHDTIKILGTCPCCDEHVHEDELWVEDEELPVIYHYSCYNMKKESEEEQE